MKRLRFVTCDVFTDRPFGGNPLAVFPSVSGLDTATMQAIAREFNFSETTFVEAATRPGCTCKVRIFTPRNELPFAGHPTLGTAHVLVHSTVAGTGDHVDLVLEEGVGPVPVRVTLDAGLPIFAELTAARIPEAGPAPPDIPTLARVLSLPAEDLLGGAFGPQSFSCGIPFLYIPLKSRAALERARIDRARFDASLAKYAAPDCFVFAFGSEPNEIRARMFAPGEGIEEDPATGSAAAALAGYLAARDETRASTLCWTVHQGVEMGRPSLLKVTAQRGPAGPSGAAGGLVSVRVGGASVIMTEGEFVLP